MNRPSIHIVGAGAFGSALAHVWLQGGSRVKLWCRDPAQAETLARTGRNPKVPDCPTLSGIEAGPLSALDLRSAENHDSAVVVLAVKARAQKAVFADLKARLHDACPVITASKGFADPGGHLLSEALKPEKGLGVLSGPSFAADLFANRPTALTLANAGDPSPLVADLSTPLLRLYHSDDPKGVQVCGALKNVIAIACGCADGMDLGASARSALMTRGLREIERVIEAYQGQTRTAAGLAGFGDLALTCQDSQSRNHHFGFQIGQGRRAAEILAEGKTVEGALAALSVKDGPRTANLDLPISHAVAELVEDQISPENLLSRLLARSYTSDVG